MAGEAMLALALAGFTGKVNSETSVPPPLPESFGPDGCTAGKKRGAISSPAPRRMAMRNSEVRKREGDDLAVCERRPCPLALTLAHLELHRSPSVCPLTAEKTPISARVHPPT